MKKKTKKKHYKHLDYSERLDIEAGLKAGTNISDIALSLNRSEASIAREIKRNRIDEGRGYSPNRSSNDCLYRFGCEIKGLCGDCNTRKCSTCKKRPCTARCKTYTKDLCKKTRSAPFCCNACKRYRRCEQKRYSYHAKIAQTKADKRLVTSREGINMNETDFEGIIKKIWPLIALQGQSPSQVWMTHKEELPISERSFYRYVALGAGNTSKIHMPKAAAYKPRKRHKSREAIELTGRTYRDFCSLAEEERASTVEMDCVCGTADDHKVLLTLFVKSIRMLFVFVLVEQSSLAVVRTFDYLEELLGAEVFTRLFGRVLTDRGSEFMRFEELERSCLHSTKRSCIYYADPCRADQKGAVENAHLFIRRILPKKTSFETMDAYRAALLMSHINSTPRKSLGGLCPLDLAIKVFPQGFLEELGIEQVSADNICLKPSLLTKE